MGNKFKIGDYVRKKESQHILTGYITALPDHQGRYTVEYDSATNDTSVSTEGLYYEDQLETCGPPTKA